MTDITLKRIDSRFFLMIGSESIEISDYKLQSSANGETELCVTIKGISNVLELLTSLK